MRYAKLLRSQPQAIEIRIELRITSRMTFIAAYIASKRAIPYPALISDRILINLIIRVAQKTKNAPQITSATKLFLACNSAHTTTLNFTITTKQVANIIA